VNARAVALPASTDVVVVGGGIHGLVTALGLARAGREVLVLERGDPWREASGVNAGSLAIQNKRLPLVPFAREALRQWAVYQRELGDVGFTPAGGLRVAESDDEAGHLRRSADDQRALGLPLEWLDGASLRQRAPWLGAGVVAATFCAEDGFASPLLAGRVLGDAVTKAGVALVPGTAVSGLTGGGDRLGVVTARGTVACRTVAITAGVWSGEVARSLGVTLPVGLDTNMLTITEPAGPVMDRIVTHVRGILTLKQYANGTCMIGGGWQGRGDVATRQKDLDYESLLHNLRCAAAVVPGLAPLQLVRSWAGLEGATPDGLPLLGRLPGHDGVFVAACARGGFTLGPVLGRLLAELIVHGETSMPIGAFAPARFLA
jgi:glycine/D-amino acid oxidase-like deaminating enzyme